MFLVPRRLSHFIPASYLLVFLLPLILISAHWMWQMLEIHGLEKQQVTQRFLDSHKLTVKYEVDSLVTEIDKIRANVREHIESEAKERLILARKILQTVTATENGLKSLHELRKHALQSASPVLSDPAFQDIQAFDLYGNDLAFAGELHSGKSLNINLDCVQQATPQSGVVRVCRTEGEIFFIITHAALDLILAIGVTDTSIDAQAKQQAVEKIASHRYGEGGEGYLFAFQHDGTYLSHPVQKYIGMKLLDIEDPNGVKINQELVQLSRNGGGFLNYVWDRYKTGQLVEKVSYAKGYADWEWVIGTGFYLDTLLQTQEIQDDLVTHTLMQLLRYGLFITLFLTLLTAGIAYWIFRRVNGEIAHFSSFFSKNISEDNLIDTRLLHFNEFKALAQTANAMLSTRIQAQRQLTDVFNAIDDVIYVADPDSYELLFVNSAVEKVFGGNLTGQKCYKVLQGLEQPCDFCTNAKIFGENLGISCNWEYQNTVNKHWYSIVDRAIQWHDGRMVRFEHARDISEKKLAEIERQAYQERLEQAVEERTEDLKTRTDQLQLANRDLEGFSYSVSHDLRAPLRAIDGFVSILSEDYRDKLDAEGLRLFGIVQDNARKMGELIDDILNFSRAGRLELETTWLDMNNLVHAVWRELKHLYAEKHVEFNCGELPSVQADPHAIHQVMSNLLINALKFSAHRDPIVIEVNAQRVDGYIRYSVSDNGVGFNEEYKDKLFVMFQRLHGMDEFEGTGVGLAIVKRFIQKHGGRVYAQATPDQGATFSFELPYKKD